MDESVAEMGTRWQGGALEKNSKYLMKIDNNNSRPNDTAYWHAVSGSRQNIFQQLRWPSNLVAKARERLCVIKAGGRTILYEVCGNKNSPVYFPVPWAQDSSMSFLVPQDLFRDVITSAGFDIEVWNDKTDLARKAFAHMTESMGEPNLPELGVHLLVGNDILTKAYNLRRNLDDERDSLIETVAVKPINSGK